VIGRRIEGGAELGDEDQVVLVVPRRSNCKTLGQLAAR
jgi:hypothetical protein